MMHPLHDDGYPMLIVHILIDRDGVCFRDSAVNIASCTKLLCHVIEQSLEFFVGQASCLIASHAEQTIAFEPCVFFLWPAVTLRS